jgi:hypothetical protein
MKSFIYNPITVVFGGFLALGLAETILTALGL